MRRTDGTGNGGGGAARLLGMAACASLLGGAWSPAPAQERAVDPPAPTSAPAPAADPQGADAILVQGMRSQELKKAIGGYVRGLTDMNGVDPIARYEPGKYCPAALGLGDARGEQIAARMRRVAEAAGVKPAPPGCAATAIVFFVDDLPDFVKAFRKQHPAYFKDPKGDLWSPPSATGPTLSWQLTQELDPDGRPLQQDPETGIRIVSTVVGGSRSRALISLAIAMSVVLVERRALVGLSTDQIADYALMRSLTDRAPTALKGAGQFSILSVLDTPMNGAANASITPWDIAYLEARYAGDPRTYSNRTGVDMRANINRTLHGKGKEED